MMALLRWLRPPVAPASVVPHRGGIGGLPRRHQRGRPCAVQSYLVGAVAAPCLDDGSCLPDGLAATVITPACDATLPAAITRQPVSVIDVPDPLPAVATSSLRAGAWRWRAR